VSTGLEQTFTVMFDQSAAEIENVDGYLTGTRELEADLCCTAERVRADTFELQD
jgi:hypothetical protein